MNILFVHQNFPAQFKFLAPELVRQGHNVFALTLRRGLGRLYRVSGSFHINHRGQAHKLLRGYPI